MRRLLSMEGWPYCARMSWASHPTTEMPSDATGQSCRTQDFGGR